MKKVECLTNWMKSRSLVRAKIACFEYHEEVKN